MVDKIEAELVLTIVACSESDFSLCAQNGSPMIDLPRRVEYIHKTLG